MIKKIFLTVLAGIVLIFLASAVIGYRTKQKLVEYCRGTTAGTPINVARETALKNGFRYIESSSVEGKLRKALVTASGVMGRVVCEIEHDGNRVVKTSCRSND